VLSTVGRGEEEESGESRLNRKEEFRGALLGGSHHPESSGRRRRSRERGLGKLAWPVGNEREKGRK